MKLTAQECFLVAPQLIGPVLQHMNQEGRIDDSILPIMVA
jgi:hypothetical protein